MKGLLRASEELSGAGKLSGTSNVSRDFSPDAHLVLSASQVHLAQKYNVTPVGTIAQYVLPVSDHISLMIHSLIDSEWYMAASVGVSRSFLLLFTLQSRSEH